MTRPELKGLFIGFLAGLSSAIGGAIKDAPYEGFDSKKFIRSPIIGAVMGALIYHFNPDISDVVGFLSSLGAERIVIESYKLCRAIQNKYVPMKFIYGEWGIPKQLTQEGYQKISIILGDIDG